MSMPGKPLELKLPAFEDLRVDDIVLMEPDGFSAKGFKAFMARYSNWTAAEVGGLTVGEMKAVLTQIGEKLNSEAVPKASGASS